MKKLDRKSALYGLGGFMVGAMIMVPTITSAHPEDSGLKGAIGEIKADVLGFDSVEDLKNSDKSKKEIAEDAGFGSREEVRDAVAKAVAESSELTDEQKAEFAERQAEREAKHEEFQAAVSKFLGMSVDELEAAREDGKKLEDLLEDAGKTKEEFRQYLEENGLERPHGKHGHGGHHRGGDRS